MTTWHVVIPVKRILAAKSRLSLPAECRADLALSMLDDVLAAALRTPSIAGVHVVSADAGVRQRACDAGAQAIESDEHGGLNGDLVTALAEVRAAAPMAGIAIVVADLPCLDSSALGEVLDRAPVHGVGYVAGIDGGTTLLVARDAGLLTPQFGPNSAQVHALSAERLAHVPPGACLDVDSLDALRTAVELGVGPSTLRSMSRFMAVTAAS